MSYRSSAIPVPYEMIDSELRLEDPACTISIHTNVIEQGFGHEIEMDDEMLNDLVKNATSAGLSPGEYIQALIYSAIRSEYSLLPVPYTH